MQEHLQKLASPHGAEVQRAIEELSRPETLPPAAQALCAHAWQRWGFEPAAATAGRSRQFQAHRLGWYVVDDQAGAGPAIRAALAALLRRHLPAEWEALLTAAGLFSAIYPVDVYIGNADAAGYTLDCRARWAEFEPFREWFRAALPLSEALSREWVTLAQVFWAHFRWQPDDWYYGTFSEQACAYLLRHAVEAAVPYPIHYYDLYRQRPTHDYAADAEPHPGELLPLHSGLGLTYFYYAQFCQYHLRDAALALEYYHRFLAAEPDCLPDNHFYLFSRDATLRAYPPSTQEALTEIGQLLLDQGQPEATRHAWRRAVALRFDNFQAPYERLAALTARQGDAAGGLHWLGQKARVCAQALIREGGRRAQGIGAYVHYDPASTAELVLTTAPGGYDWSDPSTRARLARVVDLYRELADGYFYELLDYDRAAHYYKLHLEALRPYPDAEPWRGQRLATEESRIRLALEQRDYWQARSLCEKLLRLNADNATALRSLAHIRRQLRGG